MSLTPTTSTRCSDEVDSMPKYRVKFNWVFDTVEEASSKDDALDAVLDWMCGEFFTYVTREDLTDIDITEEE